MVHHYHAIFTTYGFWLPNDPRGSWSTFVGAWELYKFAGPATKTTQRHSLAHTAHDTAFRLHAKEHLSRPPVRFSAPQRAAVTRGIRRAVVDSRINLHAGCGGYDHVHLVVGRHVHPIERLVSLFKARATQQLRAEGLWDAVGATGEPLTPWAKRCWKVFINSDHQLTAAIGYVERHPLKEGLAVERWDFLTARG